MQSSDFNKTETEVQLLKREITHLQKETLKS